MHLAGTGVSRASLWHCFPSTSTHSQPVSFTLNTKTRGQNETCWSKTLGLFSNPELLAPGFAQCPELPRHILCHIPVHSSHHVLGWQLQGLLQGSLVSVTSLCSRHAKAMLLHKPSTGVSSTGWREAMLGGKKAEIQAVQIQFEKSKPKPKKTKWKLKIIIGNMKNNPLVSRIECRPC